MKSVISRLFTTDDGQEFTSKGDAVAHELKLKLDGTVAASGVDNAEAVVDALAIALIGADRAAVRDMLADAIKLSNSLDHKPKSGGRKKGEAAASGEAAPKKSKKAAAEPAAA